jgi:hypothetical protein
MGYVYTGRHSVCCMLQGGLCPGCTVRYVIYMHVCPPIHSLYDTSAAYGRTYVAPHREGCVIVHAPHLPTYPAPYRQGARHPVHAIRHFHHFQCVPCREGAHLPVFRHELDSSSRVLGVHGLGFGVNRADLGKQRELPSYCTVLVPARRTITVPRRVE